MTINVNLTISFAGTDILQQILDGVNDLKKGQQTEMADLTALQAEVANNTTVEQSAITLINGLAAQITAAGTDPVALAGIVTQLQDNDAKLAAAITANTATPPPPPPGTAPVVS